MKHPLITAVDGTSSSYITIARARNPSIECTTGSTWEGDDAIVLKSEVGVGVLVLELLVFGELFFGYILEFLDTKGLILGNILDIILVSHYLAILNESAISSKLNCSAIFRE